MISKCSVCQSEECQAVDEAFRGGRSARAVARAFPMFSRTAVDRHCRMHVAPTVRAEQARANYDPTLPAEARLELMLKEILERKANAGSAEYVQLMREARLVLETLSDRKESGGGVNLHERFGASEQEIDHALLAARIGEKITDQEAFDCAVDALGEATTEQFSKAVGRLSTGRIRTLRALLSEALPGERGWESPRPLAGPAALGPGDGILRVRELSGAADPRPAAVEAPGLSVEELERIWRRSRGEVIDDADVIE